MRRTIQLFNIAALMLIAFAATAQTGPVLSGDNGHSRPHQRVSSDQFITARLTLMIESKTPLPSKKIPLLTRMGDGAAIRIGEILKTHGSLTIAEQLNVADMIHHAFEDPAAIMHLSDRSPISSLILLQQLSRTTTDTPLRTRLTETENFVMDVKTSK
jgi:hypothetical protein